MLTAKDILNGRPVPVKRIEVEEWGGEVFIRKLSHAAVARNSNLSDDFDALINGCIDGVCDKDGKPIFTEADRKRLSEQPWDVITRVAAQISQYSGLAVTQDERIKN